MSETEMPAPRLRRLVELDRGFREEGLRFGNMGSAVALTRALIAALRGGGAHAAGQVMLDAYDYALAAQPDAGRGIACAKGCAWCCYSHVSASPPEVFNLARRLGGSWNAADGARERFLAAAAKTRGRSLAERVAERAPCALLAENACGAYAARPLACRAMVSLSADACAEAFTAGKGNIPAPKIHAALRDAHFLALKAARKACGRDARNFDLGHALALAVETPDAEARWMAGEDVFAAAVDEAGEAAAATAKNMLFIAVLAAAAEGRDVPDNPWFRWDR